MDEQNVTPDLPASPSSKNALKFLGIELVVLILLAGIIVVVLNYFNIFSLSQRNPELFGFLPHKPYELEATPTVPAAVQPTGSIAYATDEADGDLPVFVKESLKPAYFPQEFTIEQGQGAPGSLKPNKFISTWKVSNNEFIADIGYKEKQPENRNILIILSEEEKNLNPQRATSLINTYFASSLSGEVKCETLTFSDEAKTTATFCENFQTLDGVKKGMGVLSKAPGSSVSSIFYCEIYLNSPFYSWNSCEPSKAETDLR